LERPWEQYHNYTKHKSLMGAPNINYAEINT